MIKNRCLQNFLNQRYKSKQSYTCNSKQNEDKPHRSSYDVPLPSSLAVAQYAMLQQKLTHKFQNHNKRISSTQMETKIIITMIIQLSCTEQSFQVVQDGIVDLASA